MSNFTDNEDRVLVQLARDYEVSPTWTKRTPWKDIASKMGTAKRPEQLRLRIRCLKRRYGDTLSNFPSWYFVTGALIEPRPFEQQQQVANDDER